MTTNAESAATDDRRVALVTLRDSLASAMDECTTNVLAQIAAQYRATLVELAEMAPDVVVSKADELKARRASRKSA